MSEQKLTEWFPADVKPVRRGVYEVRWGWTFRDGGGYCHWDGRTWGNTFFKVDRAPGRGETITAKQDKGWRGLAEKPA